MAAKKGDKDVCMILAKEIVHARKTISKLYTAKANLNSIQLQMKGQLATIKVTGAMQTSTEVMQSMQALVRLPEIQKNYARTFQGNDEGRHFGGDGRGHHGGSRGRGGSRGSC